MSTSPNRRPAVSRARRGPPTDRSGLAGPVVVACVLLSSAPGAAQAPTFGPAPGQVAAGDTIPAVLTGLVYDSTRSRPLSGARVAVIGTAASTVTDSGGAFRLERIPPGAYSVSFHHPRLQELGVSPAVPMITLGSGEVSNLRLAVPSRETILRGWCALEEGTLGTAHVGGVVTDSLTGVPLPNARVELNYGRDDTGEGARLEARTDELGRYRFCNVGGTGWMALRVRFGNQQTEPVAIRPEEGAGLVEDFTLRLSHEVRIAGQVLDRETLAPLQGAWVRVAGTDAEAVTGSEGRFGFTGLPPGRHVLRTDNLGYEERIDTLTVFSREALGVEIHLSTDPIPLEPLVVVGRSRGDEMPWSVGGRVDGMTRSEVEEILPRTRDMGDLLRLSNIPGLNVRRVTFKDAGFKAEGLCIEVARARRLAPESCAMVTVYVDGVRLPTPEYTLPDLDHQGVRRVQLLSPIEAGALYGQDGRNGVLLIYTR